MLRGFALATVILTSLISNGALAFQENKDHHIVDSPNQTVRFNEHDIYDIITLQLNEKHSVRFGGDVKASRDINSDNKNEAIFMAKYKFSF